jgi:hypothetical protein
MKKMEKNGGGYPAPMEIVGDNGVHLHSVTFFFFVSMQA